jgi:hypothetical protein
VRVAAAVAPSVRIARKPPPPPAPPSEGGGAEADAPRRVPHLGRRPMCAAAHCHTSPPSRRGVPPARVIGRLVVLPPLPGRKRVGVRVAVAVAPRAMIARRPHPPPAPPSEGGGAEADAPRCVPHLGRRPMCAAAHRHTSPPSRRGVPPIVIKSSRLIMSSLKGQARQQVGAAAAAWHYFTPLPTVHFRGISSSACRIC